jgi:20S proteasome subunit alpha 5
MTSSLMEPGSVEKIFEVFLNIFIDQIDNHLGCACSGLITDARTLVDHARVEA